MQIISSLQRLHFLGQKGSLLSSSLDNLPGGIIGSSLTYDIFEIGWCGAGGAGITAFGTGGIVDRGTGGAGCKGESSSTSSSAIKCQAISKIHSTNIVFLNFSIHFSVTQ